MSAPPEPARFSGALGSQGEETPSTSGRDGGGKAGAVVPARRPAVVRRVMGQQVRAYLWEPLWRGNKQ